MALRKYFDTVLNIGGGPTAGAKVYVRLTGTATPASLFADDETTPLTQPLITDSRGFYSFNTASGVYDIETVKGSDDVILTKVQLDGGGVADGSITTAKFAPSAKVPLAGTADLATNATHATTADTATNATHATAADTATSATLATSLTYQPLRAQRISNHQTAFTATCFCEYIVSGVRKSAMFGNGVKMVADVATGALTASSNITNLTGKTAYHAFYAPTINRIIAIMTDSTVWVIDHTSGPTGTWVATSLFTSNVAAGGIRFLTGHDEFIAAASASPGAILKYNCAVNPPTLTTTYTPQSADNWGAFGYDPVGDFVYASISNTASAVGGALYKIPRAAFNSFAFATTGSSANGQNPPTGTAPSFIHVAGTTIVMVGRGTTVAQLWSTTPAFVRNFFGIVQGQSVVLAGKIYGYGGTSGNTLYRLDPNSGDPIYEVTKPLDQSWGSSPVVKDIYLGTDNNVYLLVSDANGASVYQIIP